MIVYAILGYAAIVFVIAFIIQVIKAIADYFKPIKYYSSSYTENADTSEINANTEETEIHEINKNERLLILDQTLVQYNKLINNLNEQYVNETDQKKKAAILAKRITVLEKYNKALERIEKLEKS